MSSVEIADPDSTSGGEPRSSVSEPSANSRRRNRSDAGRNLWRKADSVSDIKHFQLQSTASENRKLKRTNSSVTSGSSAGGSDQNGSSSPTKSAKRSLRRLQFTSLRGTDSEGNVADAALDSLYTSARIVATPGFQLDSLLDPPPAINNPENDGTDPVQVEKDFAAWIGTTFCQRCDDVVHYVAQDGGPTDLLVITTTQEQEANAKSVKCINAIVSTIEKDEKVTIPIAQLRPSKGSLKDSISKGTLARAGKATSFEKKLMSYIRPEAAKRKIRRGRSSPELMDGLLTLVKLRLGYLHADRKFKVGVLYWSGEVLEEDAFAKAGGSEAFQEFLDFLGTKVKLKDWSKFSGGLDVTRNIDGKYSVYTEWKDNEIMFHVSTLLAGTPQQKKIHIGNDPLVIVFAESDKPFSPEYVQSKFNQVFIVVSVEKDESVIRRVMQSPRRVRRTASGGIESTAAVSAAATTSTSTTSSSKEKRLSLRLGSKLKNLLDKEKPSDDSVISPRSNSSPTTDALSPRSFDSSSSPRGEVASPRGEKSAADLERHRMSKSTGQLESTTNNELMSAPSAARIKKRISSNVFESKTLSSALAEVAAEEKIKKRKKRVGSSSSPKLPVETISDVASETGSSVFYRISVLRRDGVPCFAPAIDTPTPVFKKSKRFREFLLSKIMNGMIAAYQSPSFQDRIQINRRLFLENLKRVVVDSASGGV